MYQVYTKIEKQLQAHSSLSHALARACSKSVKLTALECRFQVAFQ